MRTILLVFKFYLEWEGNVFLFFFFNENEYPYREDATRVETNMPVLEEMKIVICPNEDEIILSNFYS